MKKNELSKSAENVSFPISPKTEEPAPLRGAKYAPPRFVQAHQDISYAGEPTEIHTHGFHEVVYCITGGVDFLQGTERCRLQPGDIVSVPTGLNHGILIPETLAEPFRRYVLWISPEFTQYISAFFFGETPGTDQPFLLHTAGTAWEYLGEYFHRCVTECEQQHFRWETAVSGIATDLAVQMARCWMGSQGQEKPELLERIIGHVEAHLAEKITLPDVAARFWVSQSTVSQLFRKKTGTSFYHYVTIRRLTKARTLIKTGIPMEQVSISVGFQDYSTFYRAFKAEFGISPAQYRKQNP